MADDTIVSSYLTKLEAALGDHKRFMSLFETLSSDPSVKQAEAAEIATRFMARTPASNPRSRSLERILKRHTSLSSFMLRREAMAGRSAA
jgi:hypothetical protein